MKLKRFLIVAPLLLAALLLQSYFWVPTYESQTLRNPSRARKYIEASIGDAKILNPILNSDTASSDITDRVFDGLIDTDENLELRGRLAERWEIDEIAYLAVPPGTRLPDGTEVTAAELKGLLDDAIANGPLSALKSLVQEIRVVPASRREERVELLSAEGKPQGHTLKVEVPDRIAFTLREVDQDFFPKLEPLIGADYAARAQLEGRIELEPANAKQLETKKDEWLPVFEHNPILIFHLRKGVRFHDGVAFTARDVKFTYESIMSSRNLSPRSSDFEPIKKIDILDDHTVRVVYKRLFSPAIEAWTIGILPTHLLDEKAMMAEMDRREVDEEARKTFAMRDSEFNRDPIGTGAFRFVEWHSDELIRLKRNDDYWEGAPEYEEYVYRVIPDYLTQEVEFRTGAVDAYHPLPHQADRYRESDAYQTHAVLSPGYTYIGYNNRRPLFRDPRVRRALAMALDVEAIIRYVMYGEAERTTGPYPRNSAWYDPTVEPEPYDPEAALRLLEEAGWKRNKDGWLEKDGKVFEFNLITNQGNTVRADVTTIAQNQWRKIGIQCHTRIFEWAVFLEEFIDKNDFDAVVLGWSLSALSPDLFQLWHTSQGKPGQLNFVGYSNLNADELMLRIRREYDRDEQVRLAHELHRTIAEDQPYTFLFAAMSTVALDKKIVMMNPDGSYSRIQPTKSGRIYFHFNRWRKLSFTPEF